MVHLLMRPCLCVLGLFAPCGPVMWCPPANNCQSALQCFAVLYVLYALERVQKGETIVWSSDLKNYSHPSQHKREKSTKTRRKQNQYLLFCKVLDVFSQHWSFLSCLFFLLFVSVVDICFLKFKWNIIVYDFNTLVCQIWWWQWRWSWWLSWLYDYHYNEAVLWAALMCCILFVCWKELERKRR